MENMQKAIELAVRAHSGQKRWDGSPYITHPFRVMLKVKKHGKKYAIAGVLHDVVEDTDVAHQDITDMFGSEIAFSIDLLTKKKGANYKEYIKSIRYNSIARVVKLADLEDNSRIEGQWGTNKRYAEQGKRLAKYVWAYNYLTFKENE